MIAPGQISAGERTRSSGQRSIVRWFPGPWLIAALALAVLVWPERAEAAEPHLRVIAQSAPVRTGPGADYREIFTAERGDIYPVRQRGSRGYWLLIELSDGTTGWILGDLVFPFEVDYEHEPSRLSRMRNAVTDAIFGPPPAPEARIGLSVSAGVIGGEGAFLFRPAVLLDPYFALEGFVGASPREQDDLLLAGAGGTLRLAPGAALGPYLHAGVGAGHIRPQADSFVEDPKTLMAISTGAGIEMTFKRRITVRIDYRNWSLFDPDEASNAQEVSSGLAIFF